MFSGHLCQRVTRRAHERLHVSVPRLPQLARQELVYQQTFPHRARAHLAHELKVSSHRLSAVLFAQIQPGWGCLTPSAPAGPWAAGRLWTWTICTTYDRRCCIRFRGTERRERRRPFSSWTTTSSSRRTWTASWRSVSGVGSLTLTPNWTPRWAEG